MSVLVLLAGLTSFVLLALRVPPEARDLGYYVNGAAILAAIGWLATERIDRAERLAAALHTETSGEPPRCYRIFGGTHCAVHAAPFRDTAMTCVSGPRLPGSRADA